MAQKLTIIQFLFELIVKWDKSDKQKGRTNIVRPFCLQLMNILNSQDFVEFLVKG